MTDVIIIGGGVIGCAIARELSRFNLNITLLEKQEDVCSGTSKANSAIVHAGFDAVPGSNKAKFNIEGNKMMPEICKELDVPFFQEGSLVVCTKDDDPSILTDLYNRGIENGCPGLEIIDRDRILELEPNIGDNIEKALFAPSAGIVCPFTLTIGYAENACMNGVHFKFNHSVTDITKSEIGYTVTCDTPTGVQTYKTKAIVNAAGVYADTINNMVSSNKLEITPRKGEYKLLDKQESFVNRTIFQLPSKMGKGILVTPTVAGNVLLGPTALNIDDKQDTSTSRDGLEEITSKASISVKNIPFREVIRSFAGLRAAEKGHDFIIGEASDAKGFYNAAGIESPGLTSAPAIGSYLANVIATDLDATANENFISTREGIKYMASLSDEEKAKQISKNPLYGNIICRCCFVSEGEIVDAINRPVGAKSLDGVKRRTGAMMGRCQGGFCSPKVISIIARELGISEKEVTQTTLGSEPIVGENKF